MLGIGYLVMGDLTAKVSQVSVESIARGHGVLSEVKGKVSVLKKD